MSKDNIAKFFKFIEAANIISVVLVCIFAALINASFSIKAIAIGSGVGAIIGGIANIKIGLPKKLKNKDERTMIMLLMAKMAACSFGLIMTFLLFTFVIYDVVEVNNYASYLLFSLGLILIIVIVEKITYKIIDNRM